MNLLSMAVLNLSYISETPRAFVKNVVSLTLSPETQCSEFLINAPSNLNAGERERRRIPFEKIKNMTSYIGWFLAGFSVIKPPQFLALVV